MKMNENVSKTLCKLCNNVDAKYVCPRCNIPYCSLMCYQSQVHVQCSESFYKECVISDLQDRNLDPDSQRNMVEILQRVQQINELEEEEEELDSDDESDSDLADRLKGIDLDDADSVWDKLTESEKQEFKEFVCKGEVTKVMPQWDPWWNFRLEKIMVEEMDAESTSEEILYSRCPMIKTGIPPFSTISKVTPSPCVRWNAINVITAYVVLAWIYNGDYENSPVECVSMLLILSKNLSLNQNFEDLEVAVESVIQESVNNPEFVGEVERSEVKEDLSKICAGPSENYHNYYILAALSELHKLITSAKQHLSDVDRNVHSEFKRRFPEPSVPKPSKSKLSACLKKIEYFLSWVKEFY